MNNTGQLKQAVQEAKAVGYTPGVDDWALVLQNTMRGTAYSITPKITEFIRHRIKVEIDETSGLIEAEQRERGRSSRITALEDYRSGLIAASRMCIVTSKTIDRLLEED